MNRFPYPDTAETRLAQTFFVVEATDFERHTLWAQHAEDSLFPPWDKRKNCRAYEPLEWEQINGWIVTVGQLDKRPICIDITWAWIEGQLICFFYPCSQVVDHTKVDSWIAEHFKGRWDSGHRPATCDANNFHHCLDAIREANKVAENA